MPRRFRPNFRRRPRQTMERQSSAKRGYGRRWRKYCDAFKAENPLCRGYTKDEHGKVVHADRCLLLTQQVDHIIPVNGPDDPLFWEPGNHQGLSHQCHSAKTIRENPFPKAR